MARPKDNDWPTYMWPDGVRSGWVAANPVNGKRKRFNAMQEAAARETARVLNDYLEKARQRSLLDAGKPRLEDGIDRWLKERLGTRAPRKPRASDWRGSAENWVPADL